MTADEDSPTERISWREDCAELRAGIMALIAERRLDGFPETGDAEMADKILDLLQQQRARNMRIFYKMVQERAAEGVSADKLMVDAVAGYIREIQQAGAAGEDG
jgi:hypothetical protein